MQVLFSPTLGDTVYVSISDSRIPSDAVVLQFRASLGRQDYEKIKRGSAKVQLWSNLPVANGRTDSSWKELDFEIAESDKHTTTTIISSHPEGETIHSVYSLSLANFSQLAESGRPPASAVEQLRLQVPVDLSRFAGEQRFGFTYRVLYADGGIAWLGSHGRDGYVFLTGSPVAGTELLSDWKGIGDGSGGGLMQSLSDSQPEQTIARLSNSGEYQFWAFDKNLYLRSSSSAAIRDAQILIIIPRIQGLRYFNEPAYVMCASQGAVLRASPSTGIISGKGPGNVTIHSCFDTSRHLETLIQSAIAHSGVGDRVRFVNPNDKPWLLLLSATDQAPTQGLLIPKRSAATSSAHARKFHFDVGSLAEMLGGAAPTEGAPQQFCVFSPSTHDLDFVDTTPSDATKTKVSFTVPSSGGEFRLSRVYDLTTGPRDGEEPKNSDTKISVLSPYTSVSEGAREELPIILPTPPPSPRLRKRFPKKNVVTFSPEPTFITPEDEVNAPNTSESSTSQEHEAEAFSLRGLGRAVTRQKGLFGLIKLFYSLFTSYLGFVFYLIFLGPLRRGESRASLLERIRARKKVVNPIPSDAKESAEEEKEKEEKEEEAEKEVEDERASNASDTVVDDSDADELPVEDDADKPSDGVNGGTGTQPSGSENATDHTSPSYSQPPHLVVELNAHLDQESGGKVWAHVVMLTASSHHKESHPDTVRPYGSVPLSGLGKRITVDEEPSSQVIVRYLKDGPKTGDDTAYYLVELAIAEGGGSDRRKTVVKIMSVA